jgi:hypothetical protein
MVCDAGDPVCDPGLAGLPGRTWLRMVRMAEVTKAKLVSALGAGGLRAPGAPVRFAVAVQVRRTVLRLRSHAGTPRVLFAVVAGRAV